MNKPAVSFVGECLVAVITRACPVLMLTQCREALPSAQGVCASASRSGHAGTRQFCVQGIIKTLLVARIILGMRICHNRHQAPLLPAVIGRRISPKLKGYDNLRENQNFLEPILALFDGCRKGKQLAPKMWQLNAILRQRHRSQVHMARVKLKLAVQMGATWSDAQRAASRTYSGVFRSCGAQAKAGLARHRPHWHIQRQ